MPLETIVRNLFGKIKKHASGCIVMIPLCFGFMNKISADDEYKPTYAKTDIASHFERKMSFKDYINPENMEWTKLGRVLAIGFDHGIPDAQNMMDMKISDPWKKSFDWIFSSNYTGNKILNSAACVSNFLGIEHITPGTQSPFKKIDTDEYWGHSQGVIKFINWANEGLLKANKVYLLAPPMATGFNYLNNLESAVLKAGVKELKIYQNWGNESKTSDNDFVTTIPGPGVHVIAKPDLGIVGVGVTKKFDSPQEFINHNFGAGNIKTDWYNFRTSSGVDQIYMKNGIRYHELNNMRQMGHGLKSNYFSNILEAGLREQLLPKDYTGLTANVNLLGHQRIVPIAPPDFYKANSGGIENYIGRLPSLPTTLNQPTFKLPTRLENPYLPSSFGNKGIFPGGYMNPPRFNTYTPPITSTLPTLPRYEPLRIPNIKTR